MARKVAQSMVVEEHRMSVARCLACAVGVGIAASSCTSQKAPPASPPGHAPSALSCGIPAGAPLTFGVPVSGSTARGSSRHEPSCVRAAARECTYQFTVETRAAVRVALMSLGFDGALSLRRADESRELACVDDTPLGDTHHTRLALTLDPGAYVLLVDGSDGRSGPFELFAELDPLPSVPAFCAAAPLLVEGQFTRASTRGGVHLLDTHCARRESGPDHVYRLELPEPARVRVRAQSEFDAVLSLRTQCSRDESELACREESVEGHALLAAELPAGSYFVHVDGVGAHDEGDYVLTFERGVPPAQRSVPEICANAPPLGGSRLGVEVDTFYAPSALFGSCGGDGAPEVVYRLSLRERAHVQIAVAEREFAAVVYVRRRCDDAESELACALSSPRRTDHTERVEELLSLELEAGDYTVVVDGQTALDIGALSLFVVEHPLSAHAQ